MPDVVEIEIGGMQAVALSRTIDEDLSEDVVALVLGFCGGWTHRQQADGDGCEQKRFHCNLAVCFCKITILFLINLLFS